MGIGYPSACVARSAITFVLQISNRIQILLKRKEKQRYLLLACRLEVQTILKQPPLASAVASDPYSAASDAGNVAAGQPGAAERRTASDMVIPRSRPHRPWPSPPLCQKLRCQRPYSQDLLVRRLASAPPPSCGETEMKKN